MASFTVSPSLSHRDIPLQTLCDAHKGKRLTVGVAIISPGILSPTSRNDTKKQKQKRKLLLLRRAPTEDAYPNMYELPGGNCEPTLDATILHTVAREALEETGLVVTRIVREFDGFEYTTRRGPARQLNFLVEVEEASGGPDEEERGRLPTPILSPEEHQAFAWVGVGDSLEGFPMSESMNKVVRDALAVMGEAELGA